MTDNAMLAPKGSAYPYYPLGDALKVAGAVSELGGAHGGASKALLANHFQAKEDAPSFSQRLAAARSYGIIEGSKVFALTSMGKRYFSPENDVQPKLAVIEFLRTPSVFKAIADKYDGNILPPTAILANVLENMKLVPKSWKLRVAQLFHASIKTAGVIDQNGYLRAQATEDALKANGAGARTSLNPHKHPGDSGQGQVLAKMPAEGSTLKALDNEESDDVEVYKFHGVYLRVPVDLSDRAWERLNHAVQGLKPKTKKA